MGCPDFNPKDPEVLSVYHSTAGPKMSDEMVSHRQSQNSHKILARYLLFITQATQRTGRELTNLWSYETWLFLWKESFFHLKVINHAF